MGSYKTEEGEWRYSWEQPVTISGWQGGEIEGEAEIDLSEAELEEMLDEIKKEKKK